MRTVMANTIWDIDERKIENANCEQMIKYCGLNTGNVCFCDAVLDQFHTAKRVWCYEIEEEGDSVHIIPAANWISAKSTVLKDSMLRLESKKVQLCVLGLGVQIDKDILTIKNFIETLPKETVRALNILSDHSVSIGVRGG